MPAWRSCCRRGTVIEATTGQGVHTENCQDEDYLRIRIRYIPKRSESLEETATPRTELSPKSTPSPKTWVPLSSELQSGNCSFTSVLSSSAARMFQKQMTRIVRSVRSSDRHCALDTPRAGPWHRHSKHTRGIPFPKANSHFPACPESSVLQCWLELEPCFWRELCSSTGRYKSLDE